MCKVQCETYIFCRDDDKNTSLFFCSLVATRCMCLFIQRLIFSLSLLSLYQFHSKLWKVFFPHNCFFISPKVTLRSCGNRAGSPKLYFTVSRFAVENKGHFAIKFIDFAFILRPKSRTAARPMEGRNATPGISPITSPRSWLKMAPPYPSSAPLLSVRWRLRSSCYCSNARRIYHPWPERGATERALIPSCALCSQPKASGVKATYILLDLNQLFLLCLI